MWGTKSGATHSSSESSEYNPYANTPEVAANGEPIHMAATVSVWTVLISVIAAIVFETLLHLVAAAALAVKVHARQRNDLNTIVQQ